MVLLVGKSLRGTYDDRVTGVDADRIDILHITYCNCSIVFVTHYLIFNFLISLDALLNQHLMDGRERQCIFHQRNELFLVIRKTAPCSAESKCRAKHDRISDRFRHFKSFFNRICNIRRKNRLTKTLA